MKATPTHMLALAVAAAALAVAGAAHADTPSHDAFTYQGQLKQSGEPVTGPVNFTFRLYDAEMGGDQVGLEVSAPGFDAFDDDGRFTIDLEFGKAIFDGTQLWLEIEVDETILSPRQPIMPAPYAVRALNVAMVADSALAGMYTGELILTNDDNKFAGRFDGNGENLVNLNASHIASGTLGGSLLGGSYTNALTFNNAGNQFTGVFAGSGAGLTGLNASNIATGNLNIARMPTGGNWALSSTLNVASNTLVVDPVNARVGIGTNAPEYPLDVTSDGFRTIYAHNSYTLGTAIWGHASSTILGSTGVFGETESTSGRGVHGLASATTGAAYGVYGESNGTLGTGVYGHATATSGTNYGVYGRSEGATGRALYGLASACTGTNYGVWGQVNSPNGYAGFFTGPEGSRNYFQRAVGIGTDAPEATLHVAAGISGMGLHLPGLRVFQNTTSPNVVGGFSGNEVGASVVGATISGGGRASFDQPNRVLADFATVSGGTNNTASGNWSTISGGSNNTVSNNGSTVGGGQSNMAIGFNATVPGGVSNRAEGATSFAAGRRAKADHNGAFVWGDSTDADFVSTGVNQFLIRASGGVGIGKESPAAQLHVARTTSSTTPQVLVENTSSTGFARLRMTNEAHTPYWDIAAGGTNNYLDFFQSDGAGSMLTLRGDTQSVGVRTINPNFTLHVNGDAGKPGGGSWSNASDIRLKHDVQDLTGSLDALLMLRGVSYLYTSPDKINELPGERVGMIAQEVAEVFPDWVHEANDGYLRLTYRGFEALVVEALRDLRLEKDSEIETIRAENDAQQAEIDTLRDEVAQLRALVTQLITDKEVRR
jgi:hypothetical protein